MGAVGIAYRFA